MCGGGGYALCTVVMVSPAGNLPPQLAPIPSDHLGHVSSPLFDRLLDKMRKLLPREVHFLSKVTAVAEDGGGFCADRGEPSVTHDPLGLSGEAALCACEMPGNHAPSGSYESALGPSFSSSVSKRMTRASTGQSKLLARAAPVDVPRNPRGSGPRAGPCLHFPAQEEAG
ncbi:uncharacterized protein LOC125620413 isoform X2 [Marmota marmota marmota]|uniref:uncharacterized protein LOC125620413 isoform X2 n=1 Tax=Marmota marmota marmota TaxID=9994 RepID=UPI002093EF85|nr:uncharacterized protein LOC125620413 isoform X2 [Marmota marmota marmota]